MPSNRTKRTRNITIPTSETAWAILNDEPLPADHDEWEAFFFEEKKNLQPLWGKHRTRILKTWIAKAPCTRPECWWKFDAPRWYLEKHKDCFWYGKLPEPRLKISGAGELHNGMPFFDKGIPCHWDEETLNPDEPLFFESEAAYLLRHDLFTDTEKNWLKSHNEALEPEQKNI